MFSSTTKKILIIQPGEGEKNEAERSETITAVLRYSIFS